MGSQRVGHDLAMDQQQQQTLACLTFQRKNLRLSKGSCLLEITQPSKGNAGILNTPTWPRGPRCASWSHPPTPTPQLVPPRSASGLWPLLASQGSWQATQPNRAVYYRCGLEQKCAPHWILLQTCGNSSLRSSGLSIHSEPTPSQAASHFILVLGTIVPSLQIRNLKLSAGM